MVSVDEMLIRLDKLKEHLTDVCTGKDEVSIGPDDVDALASAVEALKQHRLAECPGCRQRKDYDKPSHHTCDTFGGHDDTTLARSRETG